VKDDSDAWVFAGKRGNPVRSGSRDLLTGWKDPPCWAGLGISILNAVLAAYTAELYPIVVRARSSGLSAGATKPAVSTDRLCAEPLAFFLPQIYCAKDEPHCHPYALACAHCSSVHALVDETTTLPRRQRPGAPAAPDRCRRQVNAIGSARDRGRHVR
jgi:hypothetical protein